MSLCKDCPNRSICMSLCPEAEVYANQDYIPRTELPIGLPRYIKEAEGKIDPVELEANTIINAILERLAKKNRGLKIEYLYHLGFRPKEISQLLGITIKSVRNRLSKMRKRGAKFFL